MQIQRFSEIIEILGKYGFNIALEKLFPGYSRVRLPFHGVSPEPSTMYERMRLAIEELGPTFVKLGQIMSTRTDILPQEMIRELKKLQDNVKPVPFSEIYPVIEEQCPGFDTWFREIDEIPVASASIAQVHSAILRDGTQVALKIQRPGIGQVIETDLRILQSMAERVERVFPEARIYNPTGMVKDFAHQIRKELDFREEAKTSERMKQNFREVSGIHFPKIYREYSSSRILVMEFVEGVRIDNLKEITAMGLDPHEIGERGFHAYLKMIFEDGFFHGDPHPGNLLVTKDGTIVVLDFGIAGTIRPEKRQNFINFLFALMNKDTDLMIKSLEKFGVVIPAENREPLQDDLFVLIQDLGLDQNISRFNFPLFVAELSEVMRHYRIKVPMNLMLLLKVLVMILDIGVHLNPEFNIEQELSPFLVRIAQKNTFSATSAKKASVSLLETTDAVLDMPRHLNLMLNRFSSGTFRLELVDKDIREFQTALDSASDKLMLGLVVGSLVVGSSLVLSSNPLPLPPEVSWLAVAGYSAAALTVLYVVYHVIYLRFRER
ncbi:AarF/ABC1/UbiB kinase family protein [Methanoregula sp.]|uniref:ABC1 kinase family protein n=1 Tax=Methanoregula sp. TaxID=2052170 RepID=UPI00261A4110|nr:AarF/ABC1/UbiB kinase family protein [Methanoregula sp.]MDD5143713.1 AarF/ABC1/UbiB kinase family protein [Methanoregula sp.]